MKALGKLERLDPREVWSHEAHEFTPWLLVNIGELGEALGVDLEEATAEVAVGDFAVDIEAQTSGPDARPVIIENQLEPTDHGHLGQLLTYAAGRDAAIIVWISAKVREEHRSAIDWLNSISDEGIDSAGTSGIANWQHTMGFKSVHPGGAHFAMGDGSVNFINESIDYKLFNELGTKAGGEVASLPE